MSDFADQALGTVCKTLQERIRDLHFVSIHTRLHYIQLLEDCAKRAQENESGDKVSSFNSMVDDLDKEFSVRTGRYLPRS